MHDYRNDHIVETHKFDGCTVYICDTAYKDKTQEQIDRDINQMREVARDILRKRALRAAQSGA